MAGPTSVHASKFGWRASCAGAALLLLFAEGSAQAALQWAGRSWNVTSGGMAGVAEGSPSNVSVDASGYLHLKITKTGDAWTAAELFTTDKLGFGTYQWQVDAPIDRFDKNVVLGLYPYGPAAGIGKDGTNEIDIEYSFWGNANGVNGDWTDYPASGKTIGEKSYKFSLGGGTLSTSRFIWSTSKIENFLINGVQPVGSVTDLINSWTYAPADSTINVPQQALPLGINLWCFDAPPSDGKDVEVVIRSFEFVAEGTAPAGGGGAGGGGASGMSAAGASTGGAVGTAGTAAGGASAAGAAVGGASSPSAGGAGAAAGNEASTGGGGASPGSAGQSTSGGASSASVGGAGAGAPPSGNAGQDNAAQGSGCSVSSAGERTSTGLFIGLSLLVLGGRARRRRCT